MLKFESNDVAMDLRNVAREPAPAVRVLVPMHAVQGDEVLPALALRQRERSVWPSGIGEHRPWSARRLFAVDVAVKEEKAVMREATMKGRIPAMRTVPRVAMPIVEAMGPGGALGSQAASTRAKPAGSLFTRLSWLVYRFSARLAGPEHAAAALRQQRVIERNARWGR